MQNATVDENEFSRWDHGWDVFILDHQNGLIGQTRATRWDEIEVAARRLMVEIAIPDARLIPLTRING
jgi:hypothetical protein